MNQKQIDDTIEFLRSQGYAVVVFEPIELQNANPSKLEDHLIGHAWDFISLNNETNEEAV